MHSYLSGQERGPDIVAKQDLLGSIVASSCLHSHHSTVFRQKLRDRRLFLKGGPGGTSGLRDGAVAPPQGEFWDESALYIGAIRPGAARDWTDGWTDFPLN